MIKRIFLQLFLVLFVFFVFPNSVLAKGEFASSYRVTYSVQEDGWTDVVENITLKNLTDKYYPSSFSLIIGATQISDVSATDNSGALQIGSQVQGKSTQINVKFTGEQVVGIGKEYNWTLKFRSKDFAENIGKVWQVSVPKISSAEDLADYNLTLSVPVSFGDPTSILPEPNNVNESGGRLNLNFNKEQLAQSGIIANFGDNQIFDFNLNFHLTNNGLLPAEAELPLPADTNYQEVLISDINPKPENVYLDKDGNYIGIFKVGRKESLQVNVKGLAKLYLKPYQKSLPLSAKEIQTYTETQKYWDKDNPQIKNKLTEIFAGKDASTNYKKAELIHRFVANFLKYDETRIKSDDFERLGGVTALNNPDKALCSEYTDLFITLARAAGIPARELTGFGYTSNTDIRPRSFGGSVLHAWPEFFDNDLGWVMIDPTWENSTGGVDYFTKFDLSHLVLAIRGVNSDSPSTADTVDVKFSEAEFKKSEKVSLNLEVNNEILAGFPAKATVRIQNLGNTFYNSNKFSLSSSKITFLDKGVASSAKAFNTPFIPPFGSLTYTYDLRTGPAWQSYQDIIEGRLGEDIFSSQTVLVKPIFAYKVFTGAVFGLILFFFAIYAVTFWGHMHVHKKSLDHNPLKEKKS